MCPDSTQSRIHEAGGMSQLGYRKSRRSGLAVHAVTVSGRILRGQIWQDRSWEGWRFDHGGFLDQPFGGSKRPCRSGDAVDGQHIDTASALHSNTENASLAVARFNQACPPTPDILDDLRELPSGKHDPVATQKLAVKMPFGVGDVCPKPTRVEIGIVERQRIPPKNI